MTPLAALAAAIRERLVSGHPAPLPGLGTLVRQHVSARVEERPDGARVLLPPGETIGLADLDDTHESLAEEFGRAQGLAGDQAETAFAEAMDQVEARLATTGEARLPGVGLLRRTSGGVILGVEADLLSAVNRTFEGLPPVATGASADAPAEADAPPEAAPKSPAEADGPLRDLSSTGPTAPFQPPVAPEESGEADDLLDTDWQLPSVPTEPSSEDEDDVFTEEEIPEAAVDDDTLDADLDDVLAVPFGGPSDEPLTDVLPPTPTERDEPPAADDLPPQAVQAEGEPAPDEPDVAEEGHSATGALPAADPPPLAPGADSPEIEDGDGAHAEASPPAAAAPPADEADVSVDRVGPDAEFDALLPPPAAPESTAPPPGTAAASAPAAAAASARRRSSSTPPPAADRDFPWWIVALVGLALAAAALWYFWILPQTQPVAVDAGSEAPLAAPQEAPPAPADDPAADSLGAAGTPTGTTPDGTAADGAAASGAAQAPPSGPPAGASPVTPAPAPPAAQRAPAGRSGRAPADRTRPTDVAILPPRLAGLDAEDIRALSGDTVNPDADAWTFIVLSTPSRDIAQALATRYATAGYRTAVLEVPGSSRRYRVAVGQFDSKEQANRLRDRLPPQAPPDTWVLNLRTL